MTYYKYIAGAETLARELNRVRSRPYIYSAKLTFLSFALDKAHLFGKGVLSSVAKAIGFKIGKGRNK